MKSKQISLGLDVVGSYTIFVDGASRGNPGDASIGVSLVDDGGKELDSVAKAIGLETNNVAEYCALIEGLKLAIQHQIKNLVVKADSQLVIRQMQGIYKVKDEKLKLLFGKAKSLCTSFDSLEFVHIPREQNKRADELANQALDLH